MTHTTEGECLSPPGTNDVQVEKRRKNAGFEQLGLRLKDLSRLFERRWGPTLPDIEAARIAIYVLISHLQNGRDAGTKIVAQVKLWAPWMSDEDRDALQARAFAERPFWNADEIAELLQVTEAERTGRVPKLKTIGVAGQTSADREDRRNEQKKDARKRARQEKARREAAAAKLKPSQWEREMAVLEELPDGRASIPIRSVVAAVADLPAFAHVEPKQAVHRALKALEHRGVIVRRTVPPTVPGKMPVTQVRRASAQERAAFVPPTVASNTATPQAPRAAPPLAHPTPQTAEHDAGAQYLQRLEMEVLKIDETYELGKWFSGIAERTVRGRAGLTDEQMTKARGIIDARASAILGHEVRFRWTRSR